VIAIVRSPEIQEAGDELVTGIWVIGEAISSVGHGVAAIRTANARSVIVTRYGFLILFYEPGKRII
jgi:hypothetical protein